MKIRTFKDTDVEKVNKLGRKLHDNYVFHLNEFSYCLVCEENNDIIGFVTYMVMYEKAEALDIYVENNFRRKKIGTKLLEMVIDECNKKNCENITLEVNVYNRTALDFYYHFGFEIVARREKYYNDGMDDAYVMERKFR
jgi:ribosomal-protein-alanine N-acetyltransferase